MLNKPKFITANWHAPKNIKTLVTTRIGGKSRPPFNDFNLALHVGDSVATVHHNRQILRKYLPSEPHWLEQTHSDHILHLNEAKTKHSYDASYTNERNQVCAIMTADCLPILITDLNGTTVAAIHAGWRGLANNIIAKTLTKLKLPAESILAYIGPAICKKHYEVGHDVYEIFNDDNIGYSSNFIQNDKGKYHADLSGIAVQQLLKQGVIATQIYQSEMCTHCESELFYSYRRDGQTGRIATLIWLE